MVRKYTIVNNKLRFVLLAIILFFGVLQGYSQCPTADAGGDQEMCSNDTQILLDGTATNYTSLSWQTTGSGSFDDDTDEDPVYSPSAADISDGSVILSLYAYTNVGGCFTARSSMRLTIEPEPTVNAGTDQTICETDNVSLNATATNYSVGGLLWETSGDGTFSNYASVTSIYYPGVTDISAGIVNLTLNVTANSPCSDITDDLRVTINSEATAYAGIDGTVCEDGSYSLSDANATDHSSVVWSTLGSGTFSNDIALKPTYTPSAADVLNSPITLTLKANFQSPCSGSITDDMSLTIEGNPTVYAGGNDIMCENETSYSLSSATAANYSSLEWTSTGNGSFSDDGTLNPTYSPSADDFAGGSIMLTLTANPNAPCGTIENSSMTLTFAYEPIVDAGADETICEGSNLDINDATATNQSSVSWIGGDGSFTSTNSLITTYIPGTTDINTGSVILTLKATATGACSGSVSDTRILTIKNNPTVDAGSDETICNTEILTISTATAVDYLDLLWTTSGTGNFTNSTTLIPIYTPSAGDISAGLVTLTLTASAQSPCSSSDSDDMLLTISPSPIANAGADDDYCTADANYQLSGSATNNSPVVSWATTGDGAFVGGTTLIPTYTPGATDISNGSVILTLSVNGIGACLSETDDDEMLLTIIDEPTVNAGIDGAVCESSTYTLAGDATDYSLLEWTTSGDGIFFAGGTLTAIYTPGASDIATGLVTLTLSATGNSPCTNIVTDDMELTIDGDPTANAGANSEICETDTYTTAGAVTNSTSYEWTTSGTGTFANATNLITTYTPSAGDITIGSVSLTLTADPDGSCTVQATSTIIITIIAEPTAYAGPDATICEGAYQVGASATDFLSISWSTSGDGNFADNTAENPVYTPGPTDIGGIVVLTMSVLPNSPCATTATDNVVLTVVEAATVYAGPNAEICETTTTYTLSGATGSAPAHLWTSSGSGIFVDNTQVNATYQPSAADIVNGGVTLTLTGINPPCANETSSMLLTIHEEPTVDAGNNVTICDNTTYSLITASADNVDVITWTSSGTGIFDDAALENPTYTPSAADYALASVNLTISATAISPCGGSVNDFMTLSFENEPTADAGSGGTICEDGSFSVTDAVPTNYSSLSWSGGDGTFVGGSTLTPTYTPGPTDIIWGSVTLTLTANPNTPCNSSVTDNTTVIIQARPTVDAGNDESICQGSTVTLSTASASDYSSLLWTSTGTGTFDDATIDTPVYTPTAADISAGTITLILTATSTSPCSGTEDDAMVLTILQDPVAYAGTDATICEDGTYFIFNATATNYSTIVWTTSGNGTFDNATLIHPIYTPGTDDIAAGTVTLELYATGTNPCMGFDSDQITIDIDPLPTVEAGTSSSICSGDNFPTTTASIIDYSTSLWTTSGTGSFANSALVTTTYTPSAADITAGTVTLTLTATGSGTCTSTVSDDVIVTIIAPPTADAGPDLDVCEDGITISTATAADYNTLLWTSSGSSGTLTNANTLFPTYTPSAVDIASGSVTLTLTASANTPCSTDATADVIVTISANPIVFAGVDASICETAGYTVSTATETGSSSILWSTSGDGTFLNNGTITPTYNPGVTDISNGSATITLTAQPILPCSNTDSDEFVLTIQPLATVEAGTNTAICSGSTHTTVDATALDYVSLLWTTAGTGTFNNDADINTIYTPSAADIANGSVVLTLSAENYGPCTGSETDVVTITIQDEPTADAGSDASVCGAEAYTVFDATATNDNGILWTTIGNGTFTNETTLTPTYIPGSADISSGSAVLTMTVTAMSPCTGTATSQMTITVNPIPTIFAGSDGSVCEGETFTVSDASGSDYTSITWTTHGSGSFTNANTLTPTYTPDAGDVALGYAILTLTGIPIAPCTGDVTDNMTLAVTAMPLVNAGSDETICETETVNITTATASDYLSLSWTSSGTGVFSDAAALNPTYNPSAADIAAGGVTLTLTAVSNSPCSTSPSDDMLVTIAESAIAYAGADADVCEGTSYTVNDATASNYTSVAWIHTGSGTITGAGTLTPSYIPSAADATTGSVTLTLSASGSALCPDSTDQLVLTIFSDPVVDAGSDATVCDDANYQIVGVTVTNGNTLSWTTNGTGVFSNPNILLPEYIASAADIVAGSVELTLTATANSPCTTSDNDFFTLTFEEAATADAGADETICTGATLSITSTATNYASLLWSTSGTGTFTSGTTLNPIYTPSAADILAGTVTLTLDVTGVAPCGDGADDMILTIQAEPEAYAGTNATICEDQTYTVSTATATGYNALIWTTTGAGVITNGNSLTPTYTPAAADITIGQITLSLEASAIAPCVSSDFSSMTLFFENQPTVNAGADANICEGNNYSNTDASVTDYATLLWSTSGTGTFSDATSLNTTYTPSTADFIVGSITLQLTAGSNSPCSGSVTDDVVLTLVPNPVVNAGDDGTTCETAIYTVSSASASLYNNIWWSTSGTGTFTSGTSLTPSYTPSAVDVVAGFVTLTLNAEGNAPCSAQVSDPMTLVIIAEPVADAGSDAALCTGESYTVFDANAIGYTTIVWTSSGSGTILNSTSFTPNYTPSAADFASGSVDLTLTATNVPCSSTNADVMTITLSNDPIVDAGSDDGICEGETYTLANATASDYALITWLTDGDGMFNNTGTLNPVYTPGADDITDGTVILTLSADANAPCTGTVTDYMTLTISPLPIAYAGPDVDVCEGSYTLSNATALNYTSINWTSSGTGTLTNETTLNPTYAPSSSDITNGSVDLTITITGSGNCSGTDSDVITINLHEIPEVFAGNDGTVCENGSFDITSSTASQYSTVQWTTAGDGTFSQENSILTVYTPGSGDLSAGSVTLTLTAAAIAPCSNSVSDDVDLNIDVLPTVYAGSDENLCEGPFTVSDASASNYASFIWSTSGTGVLADASTLTPTYTPSAADIINGVTLTLTATSGGACSGQDVQDAKVITFSEAVTVDAGADAEICEGDSYTISDATGSNYSSVSWSTSGSGVFADENIIVPTYIPSVDDIASGTVILTVNAVGQAPCGGTVISDMVLTIQAAPSANAGVDANIDAGDTYTVVDAVAANYNSVFWETTGTGTFVNDNTLVPTYTPSAADITAGQVTLTLHATSVSPCLVEVTDELILTIGGLPTVNAGPDEEICENGLFTVTGSSATDYSAILWTSSGTGLLTNETTLYPTYDPSANDIIVGSVILTATVTALPPSTATATNQMELSFHNLPEVNAGGDASICDVEDYHIILSTASGYSDIYWTTSGTGLFSDVGEINTIYSASDVDIANGSVILTLHAESQTPCTGEVTSDAILTFLPSVTVYAGVDATICAGGSVTINTATASDYASLQWTYDGTGTIIDNNTLFPTYYPSAADEIAGSVTLTLTGIGNAPCDTPESDDMILSISASPTISAGPDTSVCIGNDLYLASATANNYSTLAWSTLGDGTFSNNFVLNPTYMFGTADIAVGSVTLTLTVVGNAVCPGVYVDDINVTINELPTVEAGDNETICQGDIITITTASATNYSTLLWTSDGTGTFVNGDTDSPTYIPSTEDIIDGTIILTETATAVAPCTDVVSDQMILTIGGGATVYAGADASICEGMFYTIIDAYALDYTSFSWTHSGQGTLVNTNTFVPTYNPDPDDYVTGSVVITLTATGGIACPSAVQDFMILSLNNNPTADAGTDASICEGNTYTLFGSATSQQSVLWSTSGDGTFDDATSLMATYTPGVLDIGNGSVDLSLIAYAIAPCSTDATDAMILTIQESPTADAGVDATVCENTYTLSGSANNEQSILWTTSGDGTFDDATLLTATYTPGTNDITVGTVDLLLTAYAIAPCSADVSDDMTLTIQQAPTADAGVDDVICENNTYLLSGSATDELSILWISSGDGTFDDASIFAATYSPGTLDISNGTVDLSLTAYGVPPCEATDIMTLTIQGLPTADAGSDTTICYNLYTLSGNATNEQSVLWSTSGDGTFDDVTLLSATYTPGANDIIAGTADLTFTSLAITPCVASAADIMTLTINALLSADAGADDVIEEGSSYTLSGSAFNETNVLWTTSGDGVFDDATLLSATYTPGTTDITNGTVILTLTAYASPCQVSDDMTLTIQQFPTADAGADALICADSDYTLSGAATNQLSVLWTTAGDGSFDDPTLLSATYNPGTIDITNGIVTLTLTAFAIPPGTTNASDDMTITFQALPIADAGADNVICENNTYTLSGSATNQQSVIWSTSGDGTYDDATLLAATYTPGAFDINNGIVDLTLSSIAISPCGTDATDVMTLTINVLPTADAGTDATTCEDAPYLLSGLATNQQSVLWTTSGDGTFDNATLLTASYTPGATDIVNGTVDLTLTAIAMPPCVTDASDAMTLTIQVLPTADAGNDGITCEDTPYLLSGIATNQQSVLWSTSGDGTFDDATLLAATYTPGANDIINGTVDLSFTAIAILPCGASAVDIMTLTIQGLPTADAGVDDVICEDGTYILSGSATGQNSILWATSGDGTFNDPTDLAAIYTPGANDISNGTVNLTLTAYASPCEISDVMILTIQGLSTANAGADDAICENNTYTLSGTATNQQSILWTTSGDGTFDDANLLAATYIPGVVDISSETVNLTITSSAILPCGTDATDVMTLTIQTIPTANAGPDASICEIENYVTSTASVTNATSVLWEVVSGTGSFYNPASLLTTYYPSADDILIGSVTLRLTASGDILCATHSDEILITIIREPEVFAGNPVDVCLGSTYQVDDAYENYTSNFIWTTNGHGTLSNISLINPTYTPDADDIALNGGIVNLILTGSAIAPCSGNAVSVKTLTILTDPIVFAGNDDTICSGQDYTIPNASADYYEILTWSSSSGGIFLNNGTLTPTYQVNSTDIALGEVDITLSASPIAPCGTTVQHTFTLYILDGPVVDAGLPVTICETDNYTNTDAVVTGAISLLWSTAGTGTFTDATVLNTTYLPGSSDIIAGVVTLTLTADGIPPCGSSSDDVTITINSNPIVDAGSMTDICENPTLITGASASNYSVLTWSTSGTGNFVNGDLIEPTYYPSAADIIAGSVTLTLTADPLAPCLVSANSSILVNILPEPTVDAGPDDEICGITAYTLSGASQTNAISILWTSSGTGIFADATTINPIYTPSADDVILGAVTLTVEASSAACGTVTDFMILVINSIPVVDAGQDSSVCVSGTYTANGTIIGNYSLIEWTHNGAGNLTFVNSLTPIYAPDASEIGNTVLLTMTVTASLPCTGTVSDALSLIVVDEPTAGAGNDTTICETDSYTVVGATASNYSNIFWTTSGDGSFSAGGLDPTYFPGLNDIVAGFVDLTIHVQNPPCSDATDQMRLYIINQPTVDAGLDASICEIESYLLSGSAIDYLSVLWTTSGDGTFINATSLTANYTPGPADIINGTVDLSLTAIALAPCVNSISDFMTLTIQGLPTANAGADDVICEDDTYTLIGSATNALSVLWTTTGDGTFNTPASLIATYTPGVNDIINGFVDLTLTTYPIAPCGTSASDEMRLTIQELPFADAGADDAICENNTYTLSGDVLNEQSSLWTTSGDGTFDDPTILVSTYTPGIGDILNGSVDLSLTAYAIAPCGTDAIDDMTLTIQGLPVADAGADASICEFSIYTLSGSAINAQSILWTTSGDGTFDDPTSYTATYTHGVVDATLGFATLTLTAASIIPCSSDVSDDMTLLITPGPIPNFTYSIIVCDSLQFTDLTTSPPGYTIVTWNWDFGDGTTSDLQNPTHQYPHTTTPGGEIYNVELTVLADSNGFTCSGTIVLLVTVPELPDIFYTFTPDPTCIGDTTHFYGESGYPIDIWHWDFGDGDFSTNQDADHLYTSIGDYDVVLDIIDNNGCANTLSNVVTVSPIPEVSFTMSDSLTCQGSTISFTATGTNIDTWSWDFGDGSFSNQQNPIHYYTSGGTYTVILTVEEISGCSNNTSKQVIILPGPTADYSYANLDCSTVVFTDLSTSPPGYNLVEWYWDFDDGFTSNLQHPSHIFTTGIGVYDVMLIVTADSSGYSCSDTIIQTVLTPGLPTVFFTWNPEPTLLGDPTNFFGTSGNTITDWYWDFGDGNTESIQSPTHTYATIGTFEVSLTITDIDGCMNSILHQVNVTNVPVLDFSWIHGCEGEAVQFTVLDPPTDIPSVVSWSWSFGDGGTSTTMDPLHVYDVADTYQVSLTILDTMGATNTLTKSITINPLPLAIFSMESPTCSGNPVQFHDYSDPITGYITEWYWDFGDGSDTTILFPDNPDVNHTYTNTGTYQVMLTITNSDSCSNSATNPVTTIPGPIAMFTHSSSCSSGPVSFTDTSEKNGGGTIVSWQWNFDDPASGPDNTSTLQNPIHIFSTEGDYEVELIITNVNGCIDTTQSTVTISGQPTVDFLYSEACLGSQTQFEVDTTVTNIAEIQSYTWAFGDGNTSVLPNPSHIYAATGDYEVTLTIVTIDGCVASVSHTVQINPLPNANFDYSPSACLNDTVYFTDLSSSPNGIISIWHWDFGDGIDITITAPDNPDVSHIYTNGGIYAVTLTVTDSDSCENMIEKQVEVVPSPIADYSYEETCYNEPVYFTDLSSTNQGPDIYSWEWFFGDPLSGIENYSTLQNPTHIFTNPNPEEPYIVTLIVLSTHGCSDTTWQEITVDSLPYVDFSILDDSICLGENAEFTGIGTNISTWFWEFGDGGYSIEQSPSYMYGTPGTYIVTLTVTEIGIDQCQNVSIDTIHVNDAPTANFDYENICLGDSTYFTDLSYSQYGFIVGWEWDFGDGSTSTEEDPVHYYQDNDEYLVTLVSIDNYGCSDTITQWIQVFDTPLPGFTFNQVCEPEGQVNFFDESEPGADDSPIVGWNWNLYDGYYSTEIDPSYIYPETDTCYTVILEITDGNGCIATDTNDMICLHGILEIDFTSTEECLGIPTFFTASYSPQSDSVAAYTWNFNDGTPNQDTYHDTISHTFPNPGLFIVELMALDTNGCMTTAYHEVIIDSLPTARFSNTIGSCDTPTQFTDESLDGGAFIESWYWDFGDVISPNNTSTEQHPSHLYGPYDSTYQVKLVITNFNGCTDSIVQEVYVEPCLIADFELPTGLTCARYEQCFTDISELSSNNGLITQWRWDFGDGETYNYGIQQNPICHTYEEGGDYEVQLIVVAEISGIIYQDTVVKMLTIHPTPEAGIYVEANCLGDSTRFYDDTNTNGEPLTMWHWNFGDNINPNDTSILQNPTYLYPGYGTYITELQVMNQYGCSDSISEPIEIYRPPEAAFSYEETCKSYYTYFMDETIADSSDIEHYIWNFGDTLTIGDTSSLQYPSYIYDSTGYYTVELTVTDGHQCYDTISHIVEIYPIPTASFIIMDTVQQGQIYLDNTSIESISYYWDFDYDYGISSIEENPTHQYEEDSTYSIMLISYNEYGCPDTTYQDYELLFTNLFVPNAFVPSNVNKELNIFKPLGINLKSYQIEVYSAWGNLVFQSTLLEDGAPKEGWDGTFEGKELPTGSFIWRISAVFENGEHWKGSDNGDGNTSTSGTVTLIR